MLTERHPFFSKFSELMKEASTYSPVYDLGTSKRFAKEVWLVRHLFDGKKYFAGGYNPEKGFEKDNCDFHCDIQNMPEIADNSAGSVICLEVLEHVRNPAKAVEEIYRILKPGGLCIMGVPFLSSYHGKSNHNSNPVFVKGLTKNHDDSHKGYGDFWRFTHEGLALLFENAGFSSVEIFPVDGFLLSRLMNFGLYPVLLKLPFVMRLVSIIDRPKLGKATTLHFARVRK